jgi:hypothetical protein
VAGREDYDFAVLGELCQQLLCERAHVYPGLIMSAIVLRWSHQ